MLVMVCDFESVFVNSYYLCLWNTVNEIILCIGSSLSICFSVICVFYLKLIIMLLAVFQMAQLHSVNYDNRYIQ